MNNNSRTITIIEKYFIYISIGLLALIVLFSIDMIPYLNLYKIEVSSIMMYVVITILEKKFIASEVVSHLYQILAMLIATIVGQTFIAEIFGVVLFISLSKGIFTGLIK